MSSLGFFPYSSYKSSKRISKNYYGFPLAELFGNRFMNDQSTIEILCELLLVMTSVKVVDRHSEFDMFPKIADVEDEDFEFQYKVQYRLDTKRFSLFDENEEDDSNMEQLSKYVALNKRISESMDVMDGPSCTKENLIEVLSDIYEGFRIAGGKRDWCAQSFIPVSEKLLAGETQWAKKGNSKAFDHSRRNIYCRGGEVLYLQLLLLFTKTKTDIMKLREEDSRFKEINVSEQEMDPEYLKSVIEKGVNCLMHDTMPKAFDRISDFIDQPETDIQNMDKINIGWIPMETWKEGYLFALELSRLFKSAFGPVELVRLLELECSLHVIRTMLFESCKYEGINYPDLAVVSTSSSNRVLKEISNDSFKICKDIIERVGNSVGKTNVAKMNNDYGFKVFVKIAKAIRFVVPPKGDGEHFVMSKNLLILMVSTTLNPGDSISIDSFLRDIRLRHGIVLDNEGFSDVNKNTKTPKQITEHITAWFEEMLDDCDYYLPLSDSLSLVTNNNHRRSFDED